MDYVQNDTTHDLKLALDHAEQLLRQDPLVAGQQAKEVLKVYPESAAAIRILAIAYRLQGDAAGSLRELKPLVKRNSDSPDFMYEYGLSLGAAGQGGDAIRALNKTLKLDPGHAGAWRALGDQLTVAGDQAGSRDAFEKYLAVTTTDPALIDALDLLRNGKLAKAERMVRDYLQRQPEDVSAIRILADIGMKLGQYDDARGLLEGCLELAPDFHLARHNYAVVLARQQQLEPALSQVELLLATEPGNPNFLILKGSILARMGEHGQALEIHERVLKDYPKAIQAYRMCIQQNPEVGEAYWSLANLKTFRFTEDDIAVMRSLVTTEGGDADDQAHIAFALGKALEDRQQFDESFKYYSRGNSIRKINHRHNPRINVFNTARQFKTLDAEFFAAHEGQGCQAPDPIFIVGLPRAGSTLLEQILASHSQVDGTAELTDIISISHRLAKKSRDNPAGNYPEILNELSADKILELGEGYIRSTRIQRRDAPFFIDKMPNNFQHIGLIHLILPNAKIIDARRHPMGCCFSGFKQLFARGQTFTYDLDYIGRYYRDYVIAMDHWDRVLPGRVLRVQYEDMVSDTEAQIRRMLDYCGLGFEEQCLHFYETKRAIRTPSAEQVRQPIYTTGTDQWRNYEAHLGPLKASLGKILERYPIG